MAKLTPKIRKAFALSSIAGAMMMSSMNGNLQLAHLKVQIDKAMKVFSLKAGSREYYRISDVVQEIWLKMAERHNNTLDEDEILVFIEMVLGLLPKQDMKEFLGMHFKTREKLRDDKKSMLLATVLDLDGELNKVFGTTATATRESLGRIIVKPIKAKKAKTKNRDKAVPAVRKKLRNRIKYQRDKNRKEGVMHE